MISAVRLAAIFALLLAVSAADAPPERATINIKDFGAKGDCQRVLDGVMSKGSMQLTSASARFVAEDIGKPIYVLGAAVQNFPELGDVAGAPLIVNAENDLR